MSSEIVPTDLIEGVHAFAGPTGITTDGSSLYLSDMGSHIIRKIEIAMGVVTTLAGQVGVPSGAGGVGAAATFNGPASITTDGSSLYVLDWGNSTIRKIQ